MNRSIANMTKVLGLSAVFLMMGTEVMAQSFSLGADLTSRYIWRGYDFGESLSIQPALTFSAGNFEAGAWASYSISADGSGANENDLWFGYSAGPVTFGVTDYYFPSPGGLGFFSYDGDGEGAHWIEPYVSFGGTESFPLSLYGAVFVHNDPDNSIYLQADYPFTVDGVELSLTAGAVAGESAFYGTEGFALVNLGISASKEVPITDQFSLPLSVAYILNPDTERAFLVFGVSF
jgi:hypothetical protein